MSINPLDKKIVKFLTTAQIITSVATAVKELVENSIDAEATSIDVKLVDKGSSLIEVSDNGKGIAEPDTPFVALQSYTSKIKDFNDLDVLESYGFRGEALSSLCKVAEVTVITKIKDEQAARSYNINHDGCIDTFEFCHHSVGTTVRAKSLFKDLPVRRQILTNSRRSEQEVKNLLRSFAICQPKIRLNLRIDGNNVLTKPSTESIRETLTCLFGNKFVSQIEIIEKKKHEATIKLIVPRKDAIEFNEISNVGQHVFINKRPVFYKDIEKVINKRLVDYFDEKIPGKKKLPFILILDVPSTDLDVNLEPNKTSVFLTNQTKIIEILDEALMKFYEITDKIEKPKEKISVADTSMEYQDSLISDESTISETRETKKLSHQPISKKPRLDKVPTRINVESSTNNFNKENHQTHRLNVSMDTETVSQLPVVDLGEDFNMEDISNLPNLDHRQVQTILGDVSNVDDNAKNSKSMINNDFTLEAWSKGHVNNLRGGTDVQIYGNVDENVRIETNEKNEPDSTSTGCKGFRKFSKEMRPLIIKENPDVNFVEIAKLLMSRWKNLSPEERGYYRDLGAADDCQLNKNEMSSQETKLKKPTKPTDENKEKNKKRLLAMLEMMKNQKKETKIENSIRKTIVPMSIGMEIVRKKFYDRRLNVETGGKRDVVLGSVNENFCIARTGSQLWALSVEQLFHGLEIENSNFTKKSREYIEELVEIWLREKDGMSLLHPIFDLR